MMILSFDIATRTGWAVSDTEYAVEDSGSFSCKSMVEAYKNFNSLIVKWKPELIISARPTRFYDVIRKQSEITGVLLLAAEKAGVKVEKNLVDASCKKVVLGSGKATKKDILNHYGIVDQDEADALMFIDYWKLSNEK